MKRKVEVALGIVGMLTYGLYTIMGAILIWMQGNEPELVRDIYEDGIKQNEDLEGVNAETLVESMDESGWMLIAISVAAMILGLIGILLVKGNKKPKAAGIVFIGTTVVMTFAFSMGLLYGSFYLIAGLMCLVRKPKGNVQLD